MDAYNFMNRMDGDSQIKIVDYDRTIFKNVVIYDISLKVHGP